MAFEIIVINTPRDVATRSHEARLRESIRIGFFNPSYFPKFEIQEGLYLIVVPMTARSILLRKSESMKTTRKMKEIEA